MPANAFSRRFGRSLIAGAGAIMLLAFPGSLAAQGDLLIAPTRLVLDGRGGGEVILSNVGSEEATYRVTMELRRMTPEGELEPVETSAANATEKAAMEMIRYAPRRVTLPPNQPQAVRISARPAPELPDGEYRVHLSFAAIPKVEPVVAAADAPPAGNFAIKLTPIYGITMPIIVRKGQLQVTAALANAKVAKGPDGPELTLDISRAGSESLYGDVLVYPRGAKDPAFAMRGVGVYPEITTRHLSYTLSVGQAGLMHGPVRIEYRAPIDKGAALITSLEASL